MRIDRPSNEISYDDYISKILHNVENEIKKLSNEYIINVNQTEYINMLAAKYTTSLVIYYSTRRISFVDKREKKEQIPESPLYHDGYINKYTEYEFELKYKYTGDIEILRIRPNCITWSTAFVPLPIEVWSDELKIRFTTREMETEKIQRKIEEIEKYEFINFDGPDGARRHISQFNEQLPQSIKVIFEKIKTEKEKEYHTLLELGVDNISAQNIEVPVIKKFAPTPNLKADKTVAYHVNDDIYKAIINHIYKLCKDYERHESVYKGKHEEDLRDLIVPSLNSVFIGANSSAETFNRTGKTDIITKAPDGSNIFIAECKIWRGEKMFLEAIDQLLGYVTWRDTKTALILFVKNSGIQDVIDKAKSTMTTHSCYVEMKGKTAESSFSYIYHTKEDSASRVAIELMIFHYPE